jgi:hypothetical protein
MVLGYSTGLWYIEMGRWIIILRVLLKILFRNYYQGMKHGHGKFTWPDGSIYSGEFQNNII